MTDVKLGADGVLVQFLSVVGIALCERVACCCHKFFISEEWPHGGQGDVLLSLLADLQAAVCAMPAAFRRSAQTATRPRR